MKKEKQGKKKYNLWLPGIILMLFLLIAGAGGVWLRGEINNAEVLRSYRLDVGENGETSSDLLKMLCRDMRSVMLYPASSSSHLYLHLACTAENAEELGFSLDCLQEDGFLIARRGNGLYLLSGSETGLSRACFYLVQKLTDSEGNLLIAQNERYVDSGSGLLEIVGPGGISLRDYVVVCPEKSLLEYAYDLCYYLSQSCGSLPQITEDSINAPYISLEIEKELVEGTYSIGFFGSDIMITGADEKGLSEGICEFANNCLGWMYAGTVQETLGKESGPRYLAEEYCFAGDAWIERREPIITLWNTNYSRGIFLNESTSLKTNIMTFSDEQLYEYVRMMKFCGFTGIQVTDMCSAWACADSYEFVHDRLRTLADAAHSLGMEFTLWVWGAEFTGYGWVDDSVTYSSQGYEFAYENPDVVATFEKYYSIYAELADCCDRVIAHYYDPGNLQKSEDVAYFANLMYQKFKTINPDIDFGVNCWVDAFNKKAFVNAMGNDITLYEAGHHDEEKEYTDFRNFCANSGCRLGTWAWNTCEMEIDQLAQMNYNAHIIQSVYQTARKYDGLKKPEYWSEMDSNHVLNVFSLYCAGQLLIDPERDVESLTEEIALAAVGEEYAGAFADILRLIEDARSGESWETYWWGNERYILKSDGYPAEDILDRSEKALLVLEEMINKKLTANTLPLPLELCEVLRLMVPQVEQIRAFAEFRIGLSEIGDLVEQDAPMEDIQAKLDVVATPIPEYNTVTGLWGQIEARAQQEMLLDFCEQNGYEMPVDPVFKQARKNRIYDYFVSYQKGHGEPVLQYAPYFQYGLAYGEQTTISLVQELIEEGLFTVDAATGGVYLTDWEHYKYAFSR